jgi:hypothetical protein
MKYKNYNKYDVISDGNIISYWNKIPITLKGRDNGTGYLQVELCNEDGTHEFLCIHRIIAECFISNPLNKSDVNHKNSIRIDNSVENLEWCTKKENTEHGRIFGKIKINGSDNGNSKLELFQIIEIREKYATGNYTMQQLADEYGVCRGHIGRIINGKNWK